MKVEIDGKLYIPEESKLNCEDYKKVLDLLADVYGALWIEVSYDPTNRQLQEFAKPLADKMSEVNRLIGFKK